MGSSYTTIKNLSNEYKDHPPGCIPCENNYYPGNPGTFEDLHKKFDKLETKNFEGARFINKKILSKHFNATHEIYMNPVSTTLHKSVNNIKKNESESGYKFGVSYTGSKKVNQEQYPILSGDIKTNGDLIANFCHTLGCRLRMKLSTQIKKSKYKNIKTTMEYRTDDCTVTASLIDPSIFKQEGLILLQYLQSITTRVALGIEIALDRTSNSIAGKQSNIAGAFRYSDGFQTLTTTVGQTAARVCYHYKQSQDLQTGAEFQTNFLTKESKGRFLFEVNAPSADLVFKGFLDSNILLGAVFEKKLYPIPEASLILSGLLDPLKSDVSVGIGLNIG